MSTTLLKEIISNEITSLDLSEDCDNLPFDVFALIDALEENASITTVRLDGLFLGCLRVDARGEIVRTVARLPSLHNVALGEACLLVKDLSSLINTARQLCTISFHRVVFQGIQEDFDAMETALNQHPTLKGCEISDSITAVPDIDLERVKNATREHSTCLSQLACNMGKNSEIGVAPHRMLRSIPHHISSYETRL